MEAPHSACPDPGRLLAILRGSAVPGDAERLAEHLEWCSRCGTLVDRLLEEDQLVSLLHGSPKPVPEAEEKAVRQLIGRLQSLADQRAAASADATTEHATGLLSERTPLPGDPGSSERDPTQAEYIHLLDPALEVGEIGRVGPYRVLRLLGSGGMGIVFQAQQSYPPRTIAVKMLLAGPHRHRFRQEMEVIARLQHPNIVHIHEVGEHEQRPYFTMEFVDGGDLAQKLAAGPLPARAAAQLVQTLARAMHYAHEQGFVHRDLKPSNILLHRDGTAKISDFGLAKSLLPAGEAAPEYRTESGAILGTPSYMAPEQAVGGEIASASDIYSLGAILYEALTDRPPFKAATVLETLEQVRRQEPIAPRRLQPGTPRDLETICLTCLHKEPARRYGSAAELADDLGRFLRGEPIRARPAGVVERLGKWIRRQPVLAALLAVSGLSLAALVAGGLVHNARQHAAVARAEAKEEEARRRQEEAARNYRAARDTLNRMLDRLGHLPEGQVKHREELRREMLEEALSFYQKIQGEADPDPLVRRDIALAYVQAAGIQFELGQRRPAEENYRRAIALLEHLPEELCATRAIQDQLAECYQYLGQIAWTAERRDEGERAYRRFVAISQRGAAAEPDNPERQYNLAAALFQIGTIYQAASRWAESETYVLQARDIHARLLDAHPGKQAYRQGLGSAYTYLGHLYRLMHRPGEAGEAFARAEELFAPLLEADPDGMDPALHLGPLYFTWSDFVLERGQPETALRLAGRAVDLAEGVIRKEPRHTIARAHVREAHHKRAEAYEVLGRWAAAAADWDRAVELDDEGHPWYRRMRRVLALARAGDHARATAGVPAVVDDPEVTAEGLFRLARAVALSVGTARADVRLAPAEREALAGRYASQAMALLQRLKVQGYFKDPGHVRTLYTEADWRPLYVHLDFLKLLWRK
jgi:tetratricopeptide (TPR) repeat protein